jgi:hypothetical protein
MKKFTFFCLLTVLPFFLFSQKSINKFYHKYKRAANTTAITIPGFVLGLGAGIARKHVDKDEKDALLAMELTKSIKSVRFLVMEETNLVSYKDYNNLIDGLKKKGKISELITMTEGDTRINILVRDKRKHISNFIIIFSEEDEFVMISMKTKLRYKDLNKFLREIMKNNEKIKVVPEEPQKAIEKVIPRA